LIGTHEDERSRYVDTLANVVKKNVVYMC
jgi:hypothetical protein